jgi:hypothetical protein
MKSLSRKAHTIVFILVATSVFIASPLFGKVEDNIKKSFQVEPGGKLTLETDIGSIEVKGMDSRTVDVEVIREVRTMSSKKAEDLLEDFQIEFSQDGSDVYIKAEYERTSWQKFWDNLTKHLRVKYIISVPQSYNVDLRTKGGSITTENIIGEARSRTSGGGLRFYGIQGPVWGKTSGGSIRISSCNGPAEVRTSGGGITIGEVGGNVFAHTSGGSIKIGLAQGEVDASTSGGSVRIEEVQGAIKARSSGGSVKATISRQPEKDCRLTTSGGSVTVYMSEDIAVDVDARSSGGHVHTEFPVTIRGELSKRALKAKINGGGPLLYLRTSGGSIYLKKM